jgi:hypothetical protein
VIVLTILAWLTGAAIALAVVHHFEQHAVRRYGHKFFTKGAFAASAVAAGCIVGGWQWWLASRVEGDPLNGVLLIVLGTCVAAAVVARNVRRTGIAMGTCGSLLQVSVFGVIGYFGLIALALGFFFLLLWAAMRNQYGSSIAGEAWTRARFE